MEKKARAKQNRTLVLSEAEITEYSAKAIKPENELSVKQITDKTVNDDFFEAVNFLPENFVDLLFLDPPYNITKKFNSVKFSRKTITAYTDYLEKVIEAILPLLKKSASVYVCGDWRSSISIPLVLEKFFIVRNRITWEREKGRGSKTNWKNNTEDIWFATVSDEYYFNPDAVKLKKRVIAPYRDAKREPKDWIAGKNGSYRLTYSSNIWTDISIPFWSMPENTDHPTQKPEKLLAKIILAGSKENDFVFDPFVGSGTTSVTAKKLKRHFLGIELDREFAAITEKRLENAEKNKEIQGYSDGVFWERNSFPYKKNSL
jgi:site-specific DNA-methyltransferase (adenine-specific)